MHALGENKKAFAAGSIVTQVAGKAEYHTKIGCQIRRSLS
jgi:hypothetical protein